MQWRALLCLLLLTNSLRADWPQFRGLNSAGHASTPELSDSSKLPTEFGPGNHELWSVPLASGHSSPVVVGEAIFLTTYDAPTAALNVVCVDRRDGTLRWQQQVETEQIEKGHPSFNPASSTPASDGERVVAYFGSFGLVCFDMDGKRLWQRPMPLTKSYAGNATSPIIVGNRVILYRGNLVDHFLLAVDKRTGDELWRVEQEEPFEIELACTACPIVHGDQLIVHAARSVQAYDLESGKQRWVTKCATTATSTPVIAGDEVLVAAWNKMGEPALRPDFPDFSALVDQHDQDGDGKINETEFPRLWIFHRPDGKEAPQNGATLGFRSADKNQNGQLEAEEWAAKLTDIEKFRAGYQQHGLLAIPLASQGVLDTTQVRTLEPQGIPEVPSPLHHQGLAYLLKNGGVLTVVDVAQGKRIARVRTQGKGTHYASPIIADGKLFATAGEGTISVLSLGRTPQVLAINEMHESTYATPAAVDGVLYVRTHSKLYAFGEE